MRNRFYLSLVLIFCFGTAAMATVKLPHIFSSHMVLQRNKPVTIWGWADKGEKITIRFNGQQQKVKADRSGNWQVVFPALPAGGPYELQIMGRNEIKLEDILVGDVFICSGQSNMEWVVKNTNDAAREIKVATHPMIRLFTAPRATSYFPAKDLAGGDWKVCSPATVGDFSAVAYFYGRKLQTDLDIPIGLVSTNWGGTNIQAWTSWDIMGKKANYQQADLNKLQQEKEAADEKWNQYRASLVNEKGLAEKWYLSDAGGDWKPISVPGFWEKTEIGNADGIVWFRREFDWPADFNGGPATLHLGSIDDNDITWINGQQVGASNTHNTDRHYQVPLSMLRPGKNTLVVRVTDGGGNGGFYGKPDQLLLEATGLKIPLSGTWHYRVSTLNTQYGAKDTGPNTFPSQLFNAMIHPLIQMPVAGVIWYQGESNVGDAYNYRHLFKSMIEDWRQHWKEELPFLWVQIANYLDPEPMPAESNWAELRESQSEALALPKTGQAVIIDIGEAKDIHPRNKQDVGLRLALAAEHVIYGKDLVYSGPRYESMKIDGNRIVLTMSQVGGGLVARDKYGYLRGFAIAGADGRFVWARASISGNQIIVSSPQVERPTAVRYAWANNPDDANLYNAEGLPASPFRTDKK